MSAAQRKTILLHKIDVEYRIAAASNKIIESAKLTKVPLHAFNSSVFHDALLKDKKMQAEAKSNLDESQQKAKLLSLSLSRINGDLVHHMYTFSS